MKKKNPTLEELKQNLLEKIKPKPTNLKQIKTNMRVLDLSSPFNKKMKREGKVVKIDLVSEEVHIKFNSYDLVTKLRFYENTWGLL